jgi:hypothetical protein
MRVESLCQDPDLVFLIEPVRGAQVPPHLHPLPPGERKEKQKDEILTASEYEASG